MRVSRTLVDTQGFVAEMRRLGVTPHVAQHTCGRRSAIDGRTHAGYAVSLRIRKRIEEGFGWIKTVGGLGKTRHRGTARVGWQFTLTAAAYNLMRIPSCWPSDHARTLSAAKNFPEKQGPNNQISHLSSGKEGQTKTPSANCRIVPQPLEL